MRIDLHTHSTASDGTQPPGEVVRLAAAAGIAVLGLTDHDSAAGWPEALAAATLHDIAVVVGMEISTRLRGGGAVHLLAYLPDPSYPPLQAELDRILSGRQGRLAAMLAQLQESGIDISMAEVLQQVGSAEAIGRPHVADVLIAKGVVADRGEAFATWLSTGRPGYVSRYATDTAEMVRLVTEAGGAAVIAHPWGRGSRRVLDAAALAALMPLGLVGIEVDHQDHDQAARAELRAIGEDLGLVLTGSSDFHGAGKVDHELGCNLTAPDQLARLLAAADENARISGRTVPVVAGR